MGKMRRLMVVVWLLSSSSILGASIDLVQEYSFQIPMADTIRQIAFGDIDNDGTPEVLARTDHAFALYSILTDSILFQQSYSPDSFVTYVMIGDVNRDHVKDVVIGRSCANPLDSFFYEISAFSGQAPYHLLGDFRYDIGGGAIDPQYSRIDFVRSVDIDNDGTDEVLFSYDKQYWNFSWLTEWYSDGYSYLFSHFPDSIIWGKAQGFSAFVVMRERDTTNVLVSLRNYQGEDFQSYWNHEVHKSGQLTAEGNFVSVAEFFNVIDCGWSSSYYFASWPRCMGHLLGDSNQIEFLNTVYGHQYCGPDYEFTGGSLQLRRFTPGDTDNLVWELPELSGYFSYHPAFPGLFLGLDGGTSKYVKLYRGSDGREMANSATIAGRASSWNIEFPDKIPRVVQTQDNHIRIFGLQVSTDVGSHDPSADLPSHFILNRPFPNPFNAEVTVPLSLPKRAEVQVEVFNLLGQKVAELWNGSMDPGEQVVRWNAVRMPSAVYFIRASAFGETKTAKVVLLK